MDDKWPFHFNDVWVEKLLNGDIPYVLSELLVESTLSPNQRVAPAIYMLVVLGAYDRARALLQEFHLTFNDVTLTLQGGQYVLDELKLHQTHNLEEIHVFSSLYKELGIELEK